MQNQIYEKMAKKINKVLMCMCVYIQTWNRDRGFGLSDGAMEKHGVRNEAWSEIH